MDSCWILAPIKVSYSISEAAVACSNWTECPRPVDAARASAESSGMQQQVQLQK